MLLLGLQRRQQRWWRKMARWDWQMFPEKREKKHFGKKMLIRKVDMM